MPFDICPSGLDFMASDTPIDLKVLLFHFYSFEIYFYFLRMGVLSAFMYIHHLTCLAPMEATKGYRILGAGVTAVCGLPCGCCESNLGRLQERQGLLTAETSLHPSTLIHGGSFLLTWSSMLVQIFSPQCGRKWSATF